jgi:hypothetical protein
MIEATTDPESVRRYLLGEATEEEAGGIEAAFLAREDVAEEIEAAEHELIEAYLDNRLDRGRRARFEAHYLASPVHRRRVAVTRALRDRPSSARRQKPLARIVLSAAAAAVVITAVGAWLTRPRTTPERLVAVTLSAVLTRGGSDTPTLRIGSETTDAELRLEQGGWQAGPPLQVTVSMLEGAETWRGPATLPSGGFALVRIPTDRLPPGDYVVVLTTLPGAGNGRELQRYYLRVVRP